MKILFVQSLSVEGASSERVSPIGIVILAGILKGAGHQVNILDMNMEPDPYGELKARLFAFDPDVVGISLRNIDPLGNRSSSLVPPFVVASKLIKAILPHCRLIAGGTGFSLFPKRLMEEVPEIDFGIIGEAEKSLPELISSLDRPGNIAGLCLRTSDGIRITPISGFAEMKSYRMPQRDLIDISAYSGINSYVPAVGIESKRGCPFHCAYCVYPKLQGTALRIRHPRTVVDEIEMLYKEYDMDRFHFTDPILNVPSDHLEEICNEMIRRRLNVKWDGFMREDYFSEAAAALYEKAGCECFSFSPDGLCQSSLDMLDKGLTEDQILKAAFIAAKTDVMSVYHFMVNVPGETEETCLKSLKFLETIYDIHEKRKGLGTVVLNNIRILPGTKIEHIARQTGVIRPDTDLLYPVYHNPAPYESFRYRLETLHLKRNTFMWQGLSER